MPELYSVNQPATHLNPQHGCWADRWDHYKARASFTPILDDGVFKQLLGKNYPDDYVDPDLFMHGCLDAPDEIPCGSTMSIMTIGGFYREHYNRQNRGISDWKAALRASNAMAKVLKEILDETEQK